MRIVDDDFLCFETKKRVPYQIIIETIDIKDLNNGYVPDTGKVLTNVRNSSLRYTDSGE